MIYKQISKLTTTYQGNVEENIYELIFEVNKLRDNKAKAVAYDKELKIYFDNPSGMISSYEVEIKKVKLNLCKRLKKSEDFNRKLFFRYDWAQIQVNGRGQIIAIDNKAELKDTWKRLKSKIKTSYEGESVEDYLNGIDGEFETNQKIYPVFNQYFFFGLLFPSIPRNHATNWQGKRLVELSPYEREQFEESITCISKDDNKLKYEVNGTTLNDKNTQIMNYTGSVTKKTGNLLADSIDLDIKYMRDEILNEWNFSFYKI